MSPIEKLKSVMEQLRDPKTGCPWDLEQNFSSIAPHTIEEAYEVADAIAKGDMKHVQEELGDLLFQVIFHSQLAKEAALFSFDDVVEAVTEKMIARHPHIFGNELIKTAQEQELAWDSLKDKERQAKGQKQESILEGIPVGLPSLTRALKLQKKAAKVGFDWPDIEGAWEKLSEEIAELQEAIKTQKSLHITDELGDVLFSIINVARKLRVDPEDALRHTNQKFETRFTYVETQLKAQKRRLEDATLAEMDVLWEAAKEPSNSSLLKGGQHAS